MALPGIVTPRIPITLPTKPDTKFVIRQFLTKEFKTIMSAVNTGHAGVYVETIGQIIKNCVLEPEDFNIEDYTMFEIDYLFLQLYAISITGNIEISLTCQREVEKDVLEEDELGFLKPTGEKSLQPCGTKFILPVKVSEVTISDMKDSAIPVADNIIVKLRYPKWKDWQKSLANLKDKVDMQRNLDELTEEEEIKMEQETREEMMELLYRCIESIWVGDDKWEEEFTLQEFSDWLDTLPPEGMSKLTSFLQDTPQITYTKEVVCPSCGNKELFSLVGLSAFLK